jgi:hypothetical protein
MVNAGFERLKDQEIFRARARVFVLDQLSELRIA